MQIAWPWLSVGIFSLELISFRQRKRQHNVVRLVWEFDYLHFAQYISMSPHGIGYKQTWGKKIYRTNRATWLNPLHCIIPIENMCRCIKSNWMMLKDVFMCFDINWFSYLVLMSWTVMKIYYHWLFYFLRCFQVM